MLEKLSQKAVWLNGKARQAVARARHRFHLAWQRASTGTSWEAGQGFVEYIIIVAGVLLVGAAIFVAFRVIRNKYMDASSALQGLPVDGGW